jgi:hypothetical protein
MPVPIGTVFADDVRGVALVVSSDQDEVTHIQRWRKGSLSC